MITEGIEKLAKVISLHHVRDDDVLVGPNVVFGDVDSINKMIVVSHVIEVNMYLKGRELVEENVIARHR
jgi:hypothetical protein